MERSDMLEGSACTLLTLFSCFIDREIMRFGIKMDLFDVPFQIYYV
jgi:hypothetical protein